MSVNNVNALNIIRQQINPTEEGIQKENEPASIFMNGKDEKPNPLNDLKEPVQTENGKRTGEAPAQDNSEKKKFSLLGAFRFMARMLVSTALDTIQPKRAENRNFNENLREKVNSGELQKDEAISQFVERYSGKYYTDFGAPCSDEELTNIAQKLFQDE